MVPWMLETDVVAAEILRNEELIKVSSLVFSFPVPFPIIEICEVSSFRICYPVCIYIENWPHLL